MKRLTLYPAIDLKDGACVRLIRGDMDRATLYATDPAAQALAWQQAGCAWLHVVDLNGAFAGQPINADAVRAILSAVSIPVQLGGGIRSMETIAMWLDSGASRIILGSAAVRDPALVRDACARFPGRVVIGIDARDGRVAVEGWAETSSLEAYDLAMRMQDVGAAAIIYTDISRDGMLSGPNISATVLLARRLTIPVIASGGVSDLDDLRALRAASTSTGIEGVIAGRALYDGRLDPRAAIVALSD